MCSFNFEVKLLSRVCLQLWFCTPRKKGPKMDRRVAGRNAGRYVAISSNGNSMEALLIVLHKWRLIQSILVFLLVLFSQSTIALTSIVPTQTITPQITLYKYSYYGVWYTDDIQSTPLAACTAVAGRFGLFVNDTYVVQIYGGCALYTDAEFKHQFPSGWATYGGFPGCLSGSTLNGYNQCVSYTCSVNSKGNATPPTACICDSNYQPDATATSCIDKNLNITLEIGPEVEPQKGLSFKTMVKGFDGPQGGITVTIILDVPDKKSGGHEHGESNVAVRPRGGLSDATACPSTAPPNSVCATGVTSDQAPYIGEAWFTFRAPDPAGTHSFSATCIGCTNTATASVNVKVDRLEPIPGSQFYALQDNAGNVIGAVKNKHSDNHYLTGTAIGKLENFAKAYQKTINPGAKLYLNDASLIWGGLFDVGSTNWTTPHAGHRRGVGLDIRSANSGPNNEGAVPTTAFDVLEKTVAEKGAKAALHCTENGILRIGAPCNGIPNNRHFHVDF